MASAAELPTMVLGDGSVRMSDTELRLFRDWIYDELGIQLNDTKRQMLASRLLKRLRALGLDNYEDYFHVATGERPAERQELINCVTTNKTDFFREHHHFEFLTETVLPPIKASGAPLRIWSAGCSTGEEPYTIAMTLRHNLPGGDCRVLATDIDTDVLARASRGIYDADRLDDVPPDLLRRYFLKGTGENEGKVAVRRELKDLIDFRQVNLIADGWPTMGPFDVIFCRNVIIYFDRDTQDKLMRRFAKLLRPGGHLIVGHSENLHWLSEVLEPIGKTVYRLRGAAPKSVLRPPPKPAAPAVDLPSYTLIVGDVKAVKGPAALKTLLGSCVSACLYDLRAGIGGMNHFSLPGSDDAGECTRYGVHAMELLINELMKHGADRHRLEAKVFGGGRVLHLTSNTLDIGRRNAEFVRSFLRTEGIPIAGESLGGETGRRIQFLPHLGKVMVKALDGTLLKQVAQDEAKFAAGMTKRHSAPGVSNVELF